MVLVILVFMMYFAWMGQTLFIGTITGVESFSSYSESLYNMFILLTTSNFPTIGLPSYEQQRIDMWFFIIFLVIGLFLLLNLLLAIFYESYQMQTYKSIDGSTGMRSEFIAKLFL